MADSRQRPKGLYERLLEEREAQGLTEVVPRLPELPQKPSIASPILRELEQRAPKDNPVYVEDLRRLHSMISDGGPKNWVSSAWFQYLKETYPSECERLEAEHLGKGVSLQEGFAHPRSFKRWELAVLNVNEDLVFCEYRLNEARYVMFHHEADLLLFGLAHAVEKGTLADAEAWRIWEPYRELCPHFYDPEWRDWRGFAGPKGFPSTDWIMESPTATANFTREAGTYRISGVDFIPEMDRADSPFPIGDIFEVESRVALRALRRALSGRYRILVREQREYLDFSDGLRGMSDLLDRAITEPDDVRRV